MSTIAQTGKRLSELNKLSKAQLITLCDDLISTHENYYAEIEKGIANPNAAFFMMTGGFSAIKERNNITDNTK